MSDVVVVGGGVIGLACAWRAAEAGAAVVVVDPAPGSGASDVAAGMLAPVSEAHFGEERLLALNLASARRWPSFAADLEHVAGQAVGYRARGTVVAAFDAGDTALLADLLRWHHDLDLDSRPLRSREVRALEPAVHPSVRAGMLAAGDHHVDPRAVCRALLRACEAVGIEIVTAPVDEVAVVGGRVGGVRAAGRALPARWTVLAAGCWSASVPGVPMSARPPVRPVKGEVLVLRGEPLLERPVRGLVRGSSVYLVPRDDGRVVVGATMEERGWDTTVTAGAVHDLLRDAAALVPAVRELEVVEARAGLRPGTPDNAPIVGPTAVDGLVVATGHFRNGVLLAPITADAVAAVVDGGDLPPVVAPFGADRFTPVAP